MDLLATLRKKIETLPSGDFLVGLRAVLLHIERSYEHLKRGQDRKDEQAFTDAIYRTNQAFEGSIKEAFRVLAGRNPEKNTPSEIEKYLDQNNVFKPRVLAQFTIYRTQWRNPSTHDYTLSFDQSEAFLAITSVSAFACVLIDQIAERTAFVQTSADAKTEGSSALPEDDRLTTLAEALVGYLALFNKLTLSLPIRSEEQLRGAVQGFLSSVAPHLSMTSDAYLVPGRPEKVDLLVSYNDEKALVELRCSNVRSVLEHGILHLEHAMALTGINGSVLYLYYPPASKFQYFQRPFGDGFVNLLVPISAAKSVEQVESVGDGREQTCQGHEQT